MPRQKQTKYFLDPLERHRPNIRDNVHGLVHYLELNDFYRATQIRIARTCYGDLAGWLARRYCIIKTAKPISKLFRPFGSHIILVSYDPSPATIPNSKGNLFSVDVKKRWEGKFVVFGWKSPIISETVRDRPMVTMERQ